MSKRLVLLVGLLVGIAPASAHEEVNPSRIEVNRPTFFTLNAANENKVDMVKIEIAAPKGISFGEATRENDGWTVERTEDKITWTGGAVAPEQFEQWGFEIEGADKPGAIAWKITMSFKDGTSEDAEADVTAVPAGSLNKASGGGDDTDTLADVALVVGALALAMAVAALVARSRRSAAAGATSGQDW
jgi:hypothetical protein